MKVSGMTISPHIVQEQLQSSETEKSLKVHQLRNQFSKSDGFHKPTLSQFTLQRERNCERIVRYNTNCLETVPWGYH